MKSKLSILNFTLFLAAAIIFGFLYSCGLQIDEDAGGGEDDGASPYPIEGVEEEVTVGAIDHTATATCDPSWFPTSQIKKPLEGSKSPFAKKITSNEMFHEWAFQKFLYVTKPQPNGLPLFLNDYYLVDDNMEVMGEGLGASLVLEYTKQAGSNGILMSNPQSNEANKGVSNTVYYSLHTNDIMQSAADSFRKVILNNPKDELDNSYVFPVGSTELKGAWIDIKSIPSNELGNYHTINATMKSTNEQITVALLGMHVTGVVENHPEFIWATFEHEDMAPLYDWEATTNQDVPVTSKRNKLFFEKDAKAGLAGISWPKGQKTVAKNIFELFEFGVPRTTGNAFMITSQPEPLNYNNIKALNDCMKANVKTVFKHYFCNGVTWFDTDGMSKEEQIEQILSLSKVRPKNNVISYGSPYKGSPTRGSLTGSNITMETYAQTAKKPSSIHDMDLVNLVNCMQCHTASAKIPLTANKTHKKSFSPLYISHLFRNHVSYHDGVKKSEVELSRIHDFMENMGHQ